MAVEALLQTNPDTPAEWFDAAVILNDLDRRDLAKGFLQRIIAAKPNAEQLLALGEQFGQQAFVNLAGVAELNPEAQQLADAVSKVIKRHREDSARIAALIDRLGQSPQQAIRELRKVGPMAVGPMLAALVDPANAEQRDTIRLALAAMGPQAIRPLVGAVYDAPAEVAVEAIRILANIDSPASRAGSNDPSSPAAEPSAERGAIPPRSRPALLAVAFSPRKKPIVRRYARAALAKQSGSRPTAEEALRLLTGWADDYFNEDVPVRGLIDNRITVWHWDPEQKTLVPRELTGEQAQRELAARAAQAAYELAPDDPALRRLHLATMLEQAKYRAGLDQPLPSDEGGIARQAAGFGPDVLEDVLMWSMEKGHPMAAAAAARILGRLGTAESLLIEGPRPTPLARAVIHPDRRVRLAALEAIAALHPKGTRLDTFPGAAHVSDALAFFLNTQGKRRALVAAPNRTEGMRLAGFLGELGYEAETVTNGRDLAHLAARSPDFELALVHTGITNPRPRELMQMLRYDYRSADLPAILLVRGEEFREGERMARRDPLAVSFPWPHDAASLAWQLEQLAEATEDFDAALQVPHAERQAMAQRAADLLIELTDPITAGQTPQPGESQPDESQPGESQPNEPEAADGEDEPSGSTGQGEADSAQARIENRMAGSATPLVDLKRLEPVLINVLQQPGLTDLARQAVVLLGRTGTPAAQTALTEVTGSRHRPVELRQAAADALGRSIRRHGILLTTDQIQQQYALYNASENEPPEVQRVLGDVLDHIEAPTQRKR